MLYKLRSIHFLIAVKEPEPLDSNDQFLLTKYTTSLESDPRSFLENKLFLSRRPVAGHEQRTQVRPLSSTEAKYVSKPSAPGKHGMAGTQVTEDNQRNTDHVKDSQDVASTIEKFFQEANQIDLKTLKHPRDPTLKVVAAYDFLPYHDHVPELERSLVSFDTDIAPGRNATEVC